MEYQRCVRCVMDTSDPNITFDVNGVCNHCQRYDYLINHTVFSGDNGKARLMGIVNKIKIDGFGKKYDCLIGMSGGVDSSYVAHLVKNLQLRPFAIHLDNGWNTQVSEDNMRKLLDKLGIEMKTIVAPWEKFRDLQLAFLKSSTPDCEMPTDHALRATLIQEAKNIGVNWIINGSNVRTETHMPSEWSHDSSDWKYLKAINKIHGNGTLDWLPHYTRIQNFVDARRIYWLPILNYVDYNKTEAMKLLQSEYDWKYYGGKHYESIYTRFYQCYILPQKFGYDKRKSHLSALICSGEITRDQALEELKKDVYPREMFNADIKVILEKFNITFEELTNMINAPKKTFRDYPSYHHTLTNKTVKAIKPVARKIYWAVKS